MFDKILGNYLVETNRITVAKLQETFETQSTIRVKLGLIAVSEKLMSEEHADEVNHLQSVKDKKFGDIAIEKGYLTAEQVKRLLYLQGNIYLVFAQTLIDKGFMTMDQIEDAVIEYQAKYGFTLSDMEDLKSGDFDRIVPLFLSTDDEIAQELVALSIRTASRLINTHIYMGKSYTTKAFKGANFCVQKQIGDYKIFTAIVAEAEAALAVAKDYVGEDVIETDEDALDAICEFLNVANGLFATELSKEGIDEDMIPPAYFSVNKEICGEELVIVPIFINGYKFDYVLAVNADAFIN